jgi:Protein of unknown function (DUF3891)
MVLREQGEAVVCIGQPAHAWVSGQLAAAWDPPPHPEVVLAAGQHDQGMAAWDVEPRLNPDTGRPYSFLEMPLETHLRLWSRAPHLVLSQSRRAALLVSMHGAALYARRAGAAQVDQYLAGQRALQEELRASLGMGEEEALREQRLLAAWDWMSLVLCTDDLPADVSDRWRMEHAGQAVAVDPWPFAEPRLEAACEGRRLEGRFDDEPAMREALARAPWVTLRFVLSPAAATAGA